MPYNYILDPKTRKAQGLELQDNILLLDEAHNVEKTCEESSSLQVRNLLSTGFLSLRRFDCKRNCIILYLDKQYGCSTLHR